MHQNILPFSCIYMSQMEEQIILVDEHDREIGKGGKLEAHQKGILHRAISVFVFNGKGELLLQKRAKTKYHSAGLWSNTCCSHPRPGEDILSAATRRLKEEMGLAVELTHIGHLIYRVEFPNGLTEHEYDHIFVGESDTTPTLNPAEADDWKWVSPEVLRQDIADYPERYSYWFRIALPDVLFKR